MNFIRISSGRQPPSAAGVQVFVLFFFIYLLTYFCQIKMKISHNELHPPHKNQNLKVFRYADNFIYSCFTCRNLREQRGHISRLANQFRQQKHLSFLRPIDDTRHMQYVLFLKTHIILYFIHFLFTFCDKDLRNPQRVHAWSTCHSKQTITESSVSLLPGGMPS